MISRIMIALLAVGMGSQLTARYRVEATAKTAAQESVTRPAATTIAPAQGQTTRAGLEQAEESIIGEGPAVGKGRLLGQPQPGSSVRETATPVGAAR